jgi:hypothetical protein
MVLSFTWDPADSLFICLSHVCDGWQAGAGGRGLDDGEPLLHAGRLALHHRLQQEEGLPQDHQSESSCSLTGVPELPG